MYKLGIIGYPLGHSVSAAIQKAGLESMGIEGTYDVMETPPEDLINKIKYIKSNGYNGFNVTIPLKVPMSLFLDDIDDYANIAGCVNTVKVGEDKSFHGYNTDIYGFKSAIPPETDLRGKTARCSCCRSCRKGDCCNRFLHKEYNKFQTNIRLCKSEIPKYRV